MNPYFPNLDPTKVNDYFRLGEQFTEAARQFATLDPRAIDPGKLHEAQRKNMDALVEANRRTATECEALFRDHLATLQKAAERTRAQLEAARQAPGAAPDPRAQIEVLQNALQETATELTRLAESTARLSADALERVGQQVAASAAALAEAAKP